LIKCSSPGSGLVIGVMDGVGGSRTKVRPSAARAVSRAAVAGWL